VPTLTKILINKTGGILDILGVEVPNDGELPVSTLKQAKLADPSCNLHGLITAGDVVVNNGAVDLSPQVGLAWAKNLTQDLTALHIDTENELSSVSEKVTPSANDLFIIEDSEDTYSKKKTKLSSFPSPLFGSGISYAESEEEDSTGSTTWQQKLRLTTPNLEAGNYRIGWYYEWKFANGRFDFKHRISLDDDDSNPLAETNISPKNTDNWRPDSGFETGVFLSAGVHHIDMDYCTSKSNKSAYIRRARLEIWRVD